MNVTIIIRACGYCLFALYIYIYLYINKQFPVSFHIYIYIYIYISELISEGAVSFREVTYCTMSDNNNTV
ncbi:MAG: hypothetical protein N7Q72_07385, partial [Spiroplasma sp. Tabriz.8]|nr:hypothetical protein [Spiroplasma sp. Tabriz.8]